MGQFTANDFISSPVNDFNYVRDLRLSKHVHDNVHGNIYLDPVTFFLVSHISFFMYSVQFIIIITTTIFNLVLCS